MKIFLIPLFIVANLLCQSQIYTIKSDKVTLNKKQNYILFEQNVYFTKDRYKIICDKLKANSSQKNKSNEVILKSFTASGDVTFTYQQEKDKYAIIQGDFLMYDVAKKQYTVSGNVRLDDMQNKRKLKGETVYIDELSGKILAEGDKYNPINLIIELRK
jgi:lipopolysaccharide export system protein LptA